MSGWLFVWFAGLTLVHLAVLAAMLRTRDRSWDGGAAEAGRCPECGSVNDPAYRYCRSCVSALGSGRATGTNDRPGSRRVL